ncbi:MAG TPA: transketolase C-terminal domain-containing protein [Bryobacteraceae bacterium]|nr:transketolase C-terminal domain-containing protein [Bryobacteraceae bacterium]
MAASSSIAIEDQRTSAENVHSRFDWRQVAKLLLTSRALDHLEETKLFPEKKILYQFSARGHELSQILLGSLLTGEHDGVGAYYRSRPLLLTLGLTVADALASGMAKLGGVSDGRDIGVVFNLAGTNGPTVLPMAGGVGTQYTTTAGWARAIRYYSETLHDTSYEGAIAVVSGGDGSVATNGFWSALNIATTTRLPMLFFIEDNGYGISVPGTRQTPGGDIAANLGSFRNLTVLAGDGCDPAEAAQLVHQAVSIVRGGEGPALLRMRIPRLSGHSGQDTQAYKSPELLAGERARDPLATLHRYLVPALLTPEEWNALEHDAEIELQRALAEALARPDPDASRATHFLFAEKRRDLPSRYEPERVRINMLEGIRRTLEHELRVNPKALIFGEDVGPKGGVHAATLDLQRTFGEDRVFDTSLSEEGIIGNAVGLALAGLRPVPEIQFRKYAEPAMEQLGDCGTMRWRTAGRFSAPIVVRMPGGFSKCGDPWHSVSSEVTFAHAPGWQVIMPSNAEDAVGLLRAALRDGNPTIFFEHRALLDAASARRPYPGDEFVLPLSVANVAREGEKLSVITWGAMVERCLAAAEKTQGSVEVIDLRTISPWDRNAVIASVNKTKRCLIVHEDTMTAGFGAEIAAVIAKECFFNLDAPIERLAVPDVPLPYNVGLLSALLPGVETIAARIEELLAF